MPMSQLDCSPTPPPESYAWPPRFLAHRRRRARTVLLVDDDSRVLSWLGETISALGHTVIFAANGRDALANLRKCASIDCLFSDVVMPDGMTGLHLLAAARAVRPGLPVVLTSAYPREEVYALGDIPDDVVFLPKPYPLTDLYWILDHAPPGGFPAEGAATAHPRAAHGKPH